MRCEEIINSYLESLREKFTVESTDSGCIIYTPYLDPSNDPISIFIERINDNYRISDMTQAFEYLFLHGLEIRDDSKSKGYQTIILNRLGIELVDDELYVVVPKKKIPEGILRMSEAIKSMQDLIFTSKIGKYKDFKKEVADWLSESKINFEQDEEFKGYSGGTISVDFVVPRPAVEPVFIYALHSEYHAWANRKVDTIIVNWSELKLAKIEFYSACILDDTIEENVWNGAYRRLKTYTQKVMLWEDRDELKKILPQRV